MANQKVKIDIGTSYNGRGVVQASNGFGKLNNTIIQTSQNSQKMLNAVGALGGAFGQSAGAAGKFAGAVGGVAQALAGGWLGITVGAIGLMVSMWQSAKKRAEEYRQEIENQKQKMNELDEERARAVSDRFAKEKAAQNKALAWLKDRLAAVKALVEAYKALSDAQAEGGRTRNEGRANKIRYDAQRAADAESNEAKKKLILAQGEAKATEYQGRVDVKYAEKDISDARKEPIELQKKLVSMLEELIKQKALKSDNDNMLKYIKKNSDLYGGREYLAFVTGVKDKGENLRKNIKSLEESIKTLQVEINTANTKVQTKRDKLDNTRETAKFNNEQAQKAVEEAENNVAIDQSKQRDEELKKEQLKLDKEGLELDKKALEEYKKGKEESLQKLDSEIATLRERLDKINKGQEKVQKGMEANNRSSGSGLNGGNRYGQYDYGKNNNGNGGMDPAGIARANRMAEGAERDRVSKQDGKNVSDRRKKRMAELDKEFQKELERSGGDEKKARERMGNQKSKERDNLHAWDDQTNKNKLNNQLNDKNKERDDLKRSVDELDKKLGSIETALDEVKSAIQGGLK